MFKTIGLKTFLICFLIVTFHSFSQKDTLPYKTFKKCLVSYVDVGYRSAPFTFYYPFSKEINKLQYKNNFKPIVGFGASYSWISFRLSFSLPFNIKSEEKFGKSKFVDLGVDFTFKKTFWDIDAMTSTGYAILNAKNWNDSTFKGNTNLIREKTQLNYSGINMWYFPNKGFRMQYFRGRNGYYEKPILTWYLKASMNFYGVNNEREPIIPNLFIDSTNSKTSSTAIAGFDLGAIPGVAYVNRIKNWQFGAMFGLGAMTQIKTYDFDGTPIAQSGFVARYDIKIIGGYTKENFFAMLESQFNNKSIVYDNFKFRFFYHSIKLAVGYRFPIQFKPTKLLP